MELQVVLWVMSPGCIEDTVQGKVSFGAAILRASVHTPVCTTRT
jgi:hypothetical protein